MPRLGRRKFLKNTSILAAFPIVTGFPKLFPPVLVKDDPPKTTKASKKVVSPSKPTDKDTKKKDTKKEEK